MANDVSGGSLPTLTGRAGAYAQTYIDAYSLAAATDVPQFKEQIYPTLWKNYGEGFKWLDFLRAAGREFTVRGRRLTSFVETHDEKPLTLASAIPTGTAGGTKYFQIDSDDYNADGNCFLRVGNVIYFERQYFTISGAQPTLPVAYKVTAKTTDGTVLGGLTSGTGSDAVYTAIPKNILTLVATEIPEGGKFVVGETAYAVGTGPIGGVIKNLLQYDYFTTILKEGCEIEGGANAFEFQVNGQPRLWDRSTAEADFRLDRQLDYMITMGQLNTNTALVQTSIVDGASNPVLSSEGILPKVATHGMDFPITNGEVFEFDDFDSIRELLEAKGITSGRLIFGTGSTLYTQVENCPFDWVDTGGDHTNNTLQTTMDSFGVNYKVFKKNSYEVMLCSLSSLDRATGFGAFADMKKQGLLIPDAYAAVQVETGYGMRQKMSLPNFGIGYLEGRRRIMLPRAGVNEFGYPNTDGYDHAAMDWLTEPMVFMMDFDKFIHVYEGAAAS